MYPFGKFVNIIRKQSSTVFFKKKWKTLSIKKIPIKYKIKSNYIKHLFFHSITYTIIYFQIAMFHSISFFLNFLNCSKIIINNCYLHYCYLFYLYYVYISILVHFVLLRITIYKFFLCALLFFYILFAINRAISIFEI